MRIDRLSISLSPAEVASCLRSLPLPKGMQVADVVLTDTGAEATVRASALLGLPLKFRIEIDHFSGSKVFLRVSPPFRPRWLTVRVVVAAIPGASYAGDSVIEVDLVSSSKGLLSGITLKKVALSKAGFEAEASGISINATWDSILSGIST